MKNCLLHGHFSLSYFVMYNYARSLSITVYTGPYLYAYIYVYLVYAKTTLALSSAILCTTTNRYTNGKWATVNIYR